MKAEYGAGEEKKNIEFDNKLVEINPFSNIRQEIEDYYNAEEIPLDKLNERGVQIIKRINNKTQGIGCYYYLFGNGYVPDQMDNLFKNGQFVTKEQETVVLYLESNNVVHVGWMREDGLVESKWGLFDICRHPPDRVPNSFGNQIVYVKPSEEFSEQIKKNMKTLFSAL